jgi:hypothetical protein
LGSLNHISISLEPPTLDRVYIKKYFEDLDFYIYSMKIIKFNSFINENLHDTPEEYIKIALKKIKSKIESFFEQIEEPESEEKFIKMSDALKKGKEKEKEKSKISFAELGLQLISSEFSKYSSMSDSVKIILADDNFRHDLIIIIPLEEGKIKDPNKDFSEKDIKKCFVKFKKYDSSKNFELVGQINKNIEIELISQDFLIDLKIEIDEQFGGESEKLEIETQ